jgi:hypothetical protein
MSGFINASNLGPYEPRDTRNLLSEVCDICLFFISFSSCHPTNMDKKFRISDIKSQHQCAQVGKNTI